MKTRRSMLRVVSYLLTVVMAIGLFSVGSVFAAPPAGSTVEAVVNQNSVTIGNNSIRRTYNLTAMEGGKGISTSGIENFRSDTTLTPQDGSEDFILYVSNVYNYYADPFFDGTFADPLDNYTVKPWVNPMEGGVTPPAVPVTAIKSSELTLDGAPTIIVDAMEGGKQVKFMFRPFSAAGTEWTVVYNVVMHDGDHYMRSFLEISVPEADRANAYLNSVDMDALNFKIDNVDKLFSCRLDIENQFISQFQQRMGQPLYVDSLFFGIEFQATDNRITPDPNVAENYAEDTDASLIMRYYSGKNFEQIRKDINGNFVTWPALVGAARSYDYMVVQADFYDYVNANSQGAYFRTQYNTWYDGGINITPQSISASYMNIERGLTQAGLPPIDAYITDDGYNDYSGPFWGFKPAFANNVLKDVSQMMTDAGGAFAKWISPRGGYGQTQAPFMEAAGTGYRGQPAAGGNEICAAAPKYIALLEEDMIFNQNEYNVNYWKLDGMARNICTNPDHGHMTGGIVPGSCIKASAIGGGTQGADGNDISASSVWTFTELWENYNEMFLNLRESQESQGKTLWLNSTGTSVPSPFYLLVVNSIKVVTSADSGKAGSPTMPDGSQTPDGARRLTYRDAGYYEFFNNNKWQFPYSYIWNHDPIYGSNSFVEMTDQDLRENLFGNAMRGAQVWELLFAPAIFTEGQWIGTNDALSFGKDNADILKHTRQIAPWSSDPEYGPIRDNVTDNAKVQPYIYTAWGTREATGTYEGYVSFRNPKTDNPVTISLTLDRLAGVREDMSGLHMAYVLPTQIDPGQVQERKETYNYGDTVTVTLAPLDFVILHFGPQDTVAAATTKTEVLSANTVRVSFNEPVELTDVLPAVENHTVSGAVLTADSEHVDVTVSDAFADNELVSISNLIVNDLSKNQSVVANTGRYAENRTIAEFNAAADLTGEVSVKEDALLQSAVLALDGKVTGFANGYSADLTDRLSIATLINTTDTNAQILAQDGAYSIGLTSDGNVRFTAGELTVISKQSVNDGNWHHIAAVKEPNEMIKVYIDGKISQSAYDGYNMNILKSGAVTVGSAEFTGQLSQLKVYNKSLSYLDVAELAEQPLSTYDLTDYNAFTLKGLAPSLPGTVQTHYDTTGYIRNYNAEWKEISADSFAVAGKIDIEGTLPAFNGLAVNGSLSVLEKWPEPAALRGTELGAVIDGMKANGWEILNQNNENLSVSDNGLVINANYGKLDRGDVDPTYPEGIDVETPIPGVVNENFFMMDPGLDDYTVTVGLETRNNDDGFNASAYDRLNESSGLIIRQDDDSYVRFTYRAAGSTGNGSRATMSLHMEDDGEELTLQVAPTPVMTKVYLALEKEGDYYSGYYSTDLVSWTKVGTLKATLSDTKSGFHATLGARDVPGFSNNGFTPRFFDFNVRQYPVGLSIAEDTAGEVYINAGDELKYAWVDTTFSDGSIGSVLVELPAVDTNAIAGEVVVEASVVGNPDVKIPVTVFVQGAVIDIAGPEIVEAKDGEVARYMISLKGVKNISGAHITFEIDGSYFKGNAAKALSGFNFLNTGDASGIVWETGEDGKLIGKIVLVNFEENGFSGSGDILELTFDILGKVGTTEVKLIDTELKFSYSGANVGYGVGNDKVTTVINEYYVKYDVNRDGVVDLNDITAALKFFGLSAENEEWNESASAADVNGSNSVDVTDLVLILNNYTEPYYQ